MGAHTPGTWWADERLHVFNDPIGSVRVAKVDGASLEEARENARLIASAPRLQTRVEILREALLEIAGTSANENSEPDRMADALGEIQGIVHRALEATKEGG